MFIRIRKGIEKNLNKTTKNIGKRLNKIITKSIKRSLNKSIAMLTGMSFFVLVSSAYADFSVTINKQVNIEKEQKVIAKIDGEQKLIEGLLKATPNKDNPKLKTVDINWTAILDKKGRVNIIELEKKFLTRGTNILVKGTLPSTIKIKTEEEKENSKKIYQ